MNTLRVVRWLRERLGREDAKKLVEAYPQVGILLEGGRRMGGGGDWTAGLLGSMADG